MIRRRLEFVPEQELQAVCVSQDRYVLDLLYVHILPYCQLPIVEELFPVAPAEPPGTGMAAFATLGLVMANAQGHRRPEGDQLPEPVAPWWQVVEVVAVLRRVAGQDGIEAADQGRLQAAEELVSRWQEGSLTGEARFGVWQDRGGKLAAPGS